MVRLEQNQPKTHTCFTSFRQQEICLFSSFNKNLVINFNYAAHVSWQHKDSSNMVKPRLTWLAECHTCLFTPCHSCFIQKGGDKTDLWSEALKD
ncbi:hypothetical protein I79_010396 [Cricetulus griseus]|uniref:Uncharacterized protein n=1 Tax=Cricetulus griseus TaxID=10029 RepID=G3HID5_CRIGR|nr:hypothetical protein I79_010396 [Cricetulus griseus]